MTAAGVWTEIQIDLATEAAEIVAADLMDVTLGIELRDADTLVATEVGRTTLVTLCPPDRVEVVLAALQESIDRARHNALPVDPVSVRRRQAHEDEWRDVWKQYFKAARIGRHFIVKPSWDETPVDAADAVIDLDPGRAFGTGAHPSTRLVIGLAEDLADRGVTVDAFLDLGCGSGILSIAAARLWPDARGLAVDTDDEACACTRENLDRNGVTTVQPRQGTLQIAPGPFDLILANIQAEVLQPLAGELAAAVKEGGHVLLSGLLLEQGEGVADAFVAAGFNLVLRRDEGEWTGLCLARPAPGQSR